MCYYFGNLSADSYEDTTKYSHDIEEEGTERSFCSGSSCRKHSNQIISMKKHQKLPSGLKLELAIKI